MWGWLGTFTDHTLEAVIDRGTRKKRDGSRYEQLLTAALKECHHILRPGGYTTMVFGNSSGAVWALVQRAVWAAGLVIEPGSVVILNKGQRSVKGLASGFENVATMDLIMSMRERRADDPDTEHVPTVLEIEHAVSVILDNRWANSPSHLYLELLRHEIAEGWDLSSLDLRLIAQALRAKGWEVEPASGRLHQLAPVSEWFTLSISSAGTSDLARKAWQDVISGQRVALRRSKEIGKPGTRRHAMFDSFACGTALGGTSFTAAVGVVNEPVSEQVC